MSRIALDVRALTKDFGSLQLRYARGLGAEIAEDYEVVVLYRHPFQLDMVQGAFTAAQGIKPHLGTSRSVNSALNDLDVRIVLTLGPRFRRWGSRFKVVGLALDSFGSVTRNNKRPRGLDRLVTSSVELANALKNRNPKSPQATCVYPGVGELIARSDLPATAPSKKLLYAGVWNTGAMGQHLVESIKVLGDFELEFLRPLSDSAKREVLKIAGSSADRVFFRPGLSSKGLQGELSTYFAVIFVDAVEGFGLTPMDCMALGVPVIVSKTALMQELAGPTGTYFVPTEPLSLAAKVRELQLVGAWRRTSEAGWRRASQFLWSNSALKLKRLFDELIG